MVLVNPAGKFGAQSEYRLLFAISLIYKIRFWTNWLAIYILINFYLFNHSYHVNVFLRDPSFTKFTVRHIKFHVKLKIVVIF